MGRAYYQINVWLNATVPSPERLLLLEPVPTKVCTELLQCSVVAKLVQHEGANVVEITSSVFYLVTVVLLLVVSQEHDRRF